MNSNIPLIWQYLILVSTVLISSCSSPVSPPVLPEWDTQFHIPVMLQTYTAEDIIAVDSSIKTSTGEQNTLVLTKQISIDRIQLGNNIRLESREVSFGHEIGALDYDIPNVINQSIPLKSLFPNLSQGNYAIPQTTNDRVIEVPIDVSAYFQEISFDYGFATLRLENTLPVPLTFSSSVQVFDDQRRLLLQIPVVDAIPPNKSITLQPISLAGMTLFNKLNLSFVTATPGSEGREVTINQDMGLKISGSIVQSKIRSAVAFLPAQHKSFSEIISIVHANSRILSGTVKSGKLKLQIANKLPVSANIDIRLDGAMINGLPVRGNMFLTAQGSNLLTLQLDGVTLEPVGQTGLESFIDIQTINNGSLISITSNDRIEITATLENVVMDQLTGTIQPQEIPIDTKQSVDFRISSKLRGNISYSDIRMQTKLQNHSSLPVHLNQLEIMGSDGSSTSILRIPYSYIATNSTQTITLDNEQVTQFFNAFPGGFPSEIRLSGSITLNRDGGFGTISTNDALSCIITIEIPMKVSLNNTEFIDVATMSIDADVQNKATSINEGFLMFDVENHLPAEIMIEPMILDASNGVLLSLKEVTGQVIQVSSGYLDAGGRVKDAIHQKIQMRFSRNDFRKLLAGKYIQATVRINTQENSPVVFRSTDYIKIKAFAMLNVHSDIVTK